MCTFSAYVAGLEEGCGTGLYGAGENEAPCGIPKDPELQQIMETLDETHGKSDKIGSCRGAEIRSVRFIGQSLILVVLTGLLLWRVSVFVSEGGISTKLPRHLPTCLRFRTVFSAFLWTLNITAALVLFDCLLATAVGCWTLLTRSEDTMTSANSIQGPEHPKVVVQLPMYNEREVYERAIAAACALHWPSESLVIQVLDDSTEGDISAGMERSVAEWRARGVDIRYRHRVVREGYKAGNLREGLSEPYALACEYVAVLDADFEPTPDWLLRTVPALQADPGLALVQTRWTFSNETQCFLTRWQAIELKWHFMAEQLSGSHLMGFFGFNGTGGVWRSSVILESGGWSSDTLTEDMDMAMAAAARGWRFKMLPHVECLSELPSTDAVFRKQQFRWTCGPASILRKHGGSVFLSQAMRWPLKLYSVGVYILLRRVLRPLATVSTFLLASLSLLFPSSFPLPIFACLALSIAPPLCYFAFSPRALLHFPPLALFVGAMGWLRVRAIAAGLCDWTSARLWTVTQKQGRNHPPPAPILTSAKCGAGVVEWGLRSTLRCREWGVGGLKAPLLQAGGLGWSGLRQRFFSQELVLGSCLIAASTTSLLLHHLTFAQMGFAFALAMQGLAYIGGGLSMFGAH